LKLSIFLVIALLPVCGCGKPPADAPTVPIHPVSGIVTLDGKPIQGAQVAFVALQAAEPVAISPNGVTDAEGKFCISTYSVNDGAPDGAYAATVSWPEVLTAGGSEPEFGKERLPSRYQDPQKSGLVVTVSEDLLDPLTFELTTR
jgi:hypothetical protein